MQNPKEKSLEFIEFLNRYLPWVDTQIHTDINAGGCAVFAQILYNVLISMGFSPSIIALFDSHRCDKEVSNEELVTFNAAIKESHINSEAGPEHVLLRLFKDIYLDSTGVVSAKIEFLNAFEPIEYSVLNRINNEIEWNSEYDRSLTPQIKSLLEALPEEFDNYLEGKEFPFPTERISLTPYSIKEKKKHQGGNPESFMMQALLAELKHGG